MDALDAQYHNESLLVVISEDGNLIAVGALDGGYVKLFMVDYTAPKPHVW